MNKKPYQVAPGVTRVNGARVQPGQRIELTDDEAQFDLGLDRIVPFPPAPKPSKPTSSADG